MNHSSWTVPLGSLTCEDGGNLSTRDLSFIYVSSEGRVGCEFMHPAQPNTRLNSKVRECNISRVENLNPINRYNATIFCIQSQDFEFQPHMWWSVFVFSELRWEVIVCFVDIDGIADRILFIMVSLFVINRHIYVLFLFEWQLIYTGFFIVCLYM